MCWPQAATGEDVTPEELGGAELHTGTSGVADHLAESEAHAACIARALLGNLGGGPGSGGQGAGSGGQGAAAKAAWEEPLHPPEELRGAAGASKFWILDSGILR
jgi:3-methylcrotonyl-CoA carboxylase beta subunit